VTHTSTDVAASPDTRRFRNGIIATVVVLALVCAGLVVLSYGQGPKLSSATVDTTQVVRQADQQVRLFANQNVAKVRSSQVSVSPSTPFTVTSSGQAIAVQFSERLHYATRYTVTVRNVSSIYAKVTGDLGYSFTTAPASLYYLDRADPTQAGQTDDSIIRTGLAGSASKIIYSARHIQEFTVFPAVLAVVTLNDDHTDSLSLVSIANPTHIEHLLLPTAGTIDKLQAEPDVGVLGFVFTSAGGSADPEYSSDLMTVDLTALHTVTPVLGLDGKPLSVLDWLFLSGTTSVVAQAYDQSVLLIDPKKPSASTPLGVYASLEGSSPDGKSIVVADVFSRILLTIATGKTTRLETHQVGGSKTYGGELQLLGNGVASVQQVAVLDDATGEYGSYLIYQDGDAARILFGGADYKGSIDGFTVSPNGQYVAANVVADYATAVSDGYFINPKATSITTDFIDVSSGAIVRSVAGFDESWN
jgi:hypothetical protein